MLKTIQEVFEAEKKEIRRQDYQEARLRKGYDIDEKVFADMVAKIPATESQRAKFFGGGSSFLAAFEVRDDGKAHFLGIVVDKKGVIKMGHLPPVKDVMLGHPQITHYDVTFAIPEERLAKVVRESVKSMPDFKDGVLAKEYNFDETTLTDIGKELVGEMREGEKVTKLHLRVGKNSRILKLREEKEEYALEYTFTRIGILTGIGLEAPPGTERLLIEPRKLSEVKESLREGVSSGEMLSRPEDRIEVQQKSAEMDVRCTFTKKAKLTKVEISGPALQEEIVILPRKVQKCFREFMSGENGQEWYASELEKRNRRKELESKRIQ